MANGFSLLEVLLTLAVFAFVLLSVSGILKVYFGILHSFVIERQEIAEARAAMSKLTEVLDRARREGWMLDKYGSGIVGKKFAADGSLVAACNIFTVGDPANGYPTYSGCLVLDGEILRDTEGTIWAEHVSDIDLTVVTGDAVDSSSEALNDAVRSSERAEYLVITVQCDIDDGTGTDQKGYPLRTLVCTTWPWI